MVVSEMEAGWRQFFWRNSPWQGAVIVGLGIALGAGTVTVMALPSQIVPLFLVSILSPFIAMIVRDLRRLFLVALMMDIPFRFDVNLAFREDVAKFGSIEGFNISISTFALVGLYSLWLGQFVLHVPSRSQPRFSASRPLGVYVLVASMSVFVAHDPTLSLFQILLLIQEFLLFLYIVSTVQTKEDLVFLLTWLMVGLVLEGGLIVALRFTGFNFSIPGLSTTVDAGYITAQAARLGGTLGAPNNAAAYFAVTLPIAMSLLLTHIDRWRQWLATLGLGFGGIALVITQSRGGWAACAIGIGALCFFAWRNGRLSPLVPGVIVILGILLVILFQDTITTRLSADDNNAAYSRVPLMELAFRMIQDNPILGVGTNNFAFCIPRYLTPDLATAWRYTVHNKYLLLWAEVGTIGLGVYLWFFFSTLRRGWHGWLTQDHVLAPLCLGITVALSGHAFHMLAEAFNGRPMTNLLMICSALVSAKLAISQQDQMDTFQTTPLQRWSVSHA